MTLHNGSDRHHKEHHPLSPAATALVGRARRGARANAKRLASPMVGRLRNSGRFKSVMSRIQNFHSFANLSEHDDMLADRARVDAYFQAINKHVRVGDEVVDLGTGTGLLSCFAARAGAKLVHAVEYGPIIEAAQDVAKENGITNIAFHRMSSREFSLPHRVDVIVHEQLGAAVFNEHVIANVVDLRDRLLKEGGLILPNLLSLYVAPVQAVEPLYAPFAWEQTLHGLTFDALRPYAEERPGGYFYRGYISFPLDSFLAEPASVLDVDLLTVIPAEVPTTVRYSGTVSKDGVLHGLCVFLVAAFDEELSFTTSPNDPTRCTSWAIPILRTPRQDVHVGDTVSLDLRWTDVAVPNTWRWSVDVTPAVADAASRQ